MIIDMHCHIVPENFPDILDMPVMQHVDGGGADMMIAGKKFRSFRDTAWDAAARIEDLPNIGVDKQVVSPLPELLMYHLEASAGAALAAHLNDAIAAAVRENPDHYYGLGSVPMQDVELAVSELGRVKELGLSGVEIRTNIEGQNLGDPKFRPFFGEAARLGLAVFVHANKPTFADRLAGIPDALGADAALGFGIECGLAGTSLIWGGVLAEFPDLRVCMSHGGGVLTQMLARSDNNYRNRGADARGADGVRAPDVLRRSGVERANVAVLDRQHGREPSGHRHGLLRGVGPDDGHRRGVRCAGLVRWRA